jgi:hypothetical protein
MQSATSDQSADLALRISERGCEHRPQRRHSGGAGNAWLAAALMFVAVAVPAAHAACHAVWAQFAALSFAERE